MHQPIFFTRLIGTQINFLYLGRFSRKFLVSIARNCNCSGQQRHFQWNCSLQRYAAAESNVSSNCNFKRLFCSTVASNTKSIEQKQGKVDANESGDPEGWKLVYKFKYIVTCRAIQKLKIYQTIFSCVFATPTAAYAYFYDGQLDSGNAYFVFGTSLFACVMLYVMGTLASRLIGHMYLSLNHPGQVKIARLSFWGQRRDKVYNIENFEPFSDMNVNPKDLYFPVRLYGSREVIYFSLRYGIYRNLSDIEAVFGPAPRDWNLR